MALKDLWLNFRGTLNAVLQIGGKVGVILKNNAASLQIRNAADSAYSNIAVNEIDLVDPATPTRSVQLSAPTLPAGTGYALKLPTSAGSNNNHLKSDGAGGTKWQANTGGIYAPVIDYPYTLWYSTNANGDPEYFTGQGNSGIRFDIGSFAIPNYPGTTSNTLYAHKVGNALSEVLWDTAVGIWREININAILNSAQFVGGMNFATTWGNQNPFVPQDCFMWYDGANHVAKFFVVPWVGASTPNFNKTITGVTNASPPVLTVGASHGFVVGNPVIPQDIVGTASVLNNRLFRVSAITSTTITITDPDGGAIAAPGAYTSGGKAWKIDNTVAPAVLVTADVSGGIASPDYADLGLYGGSQKAKYVCTVCYGESKGLLYDTLTRPFVYNRYNRTERPVGTQEFSSSTTRSAAITMAVSGVAVERAAMNSHGVARQWMLIGHGYDEKIDVNFHCWRVPPGVAGTHVHTMFCAKNAVTAYNAASPTDFSSTVVPRIVAQAGAAVNEYMETTVKTQPVQSSPFFGYWQAMESAWGNAVPNDWTIWTNYVPAGLGSYVLRGGFDGSYKR